MALNSGKILMRRGQEANFDPNKMMPGEWAVSLDSKYVRMCFSPGVCVRMATYEAFEADMVQIQRILEECQTIEEAVNRINDEISIKAQAVAEYTAQAKQYRDESEQFRNEAFSTTPDGYDSLVGQVNKNTVAINTIVEKAELNIKEAASGENIHLNDSADSKLVEFALYGKAVQNGTPTPENPVDIEVAGSGGSVEVKSVGKNLQNPINIFNGYPDASGTSKVAKFIENNTTRSMFFEVIGEKEYTVSLSKAGNRNIIYFCNSIPTEFMAEQYYYNLTNATSKNQFSFVAPIGYKYCAIYIGNDFVQDETIEIQAERGIVATPYELYKETLSTIPTTDFAGIKVGSNGNYTDSNGQQWIANEIVKYADGSGEKIQRIGKKVITSVGGSVASTLSFSNYTRFYVNTFIDRKASGSALDGICNMATFDNLKNADVEEGKGKCFFNILDEYSNFFYIQISKETLNATISDDDATQKALADAWIASNPMTVYYVLAEPIRTPLTAEEISEIEKLSTFYPVTNISNDGGCGMKVKYIVDSKNYIDNQLAIQAKLQEEALLNMLLLMPEEVQASMIENDTNNLLNESEA